MDKKLLFSNVVDCFSVLFFCFSVCNWSDITHIQNEAQLLESVCHGGYLGNIISKDSYVCSLKVPNVQGGRCYLFRYGVT